MYICVMYQYLVYRIFLYAWDPGWSRGAINKIVAVSVIQLGRQASSLPSIHPSIHTSIYYLYLAFLMYANFFSSMQFKRQQQLQSSQHYRKCLERMRSRKMSETQKNSSFQFVSNQGSALRHSCQYSKTGINGKIASCTIVR